jgi:hypothetical protein
VVTASDAWNETAGQITSCELRRRTIEVTQAANVQTIIIGAVAGALITANGSVRVDQPSMSVFGQHIEWKQRPPPATWTADLDGDRLKLEAVSRHEFTVRLACDRGEPSCAADGDVIETIVQLAATGSLSSNLHSEVRVMTQVQSLLSCLHTRARIEPDWESMPLSTPIRVRLFAQDVDDLPINFTRAEIHLAFRDRTLPMQWRGRGSNEYVADVPAELIAQSGLFDLVVTASDAWNETAGQITSCELLRFNVRIVSGVDIPYIILGVLAGLAILALGALLAYQIRSHQDETKRFVESFFKHEGQLAFKICWDAWVRPSPHAVPRV